MVVNISSKKYQDIKAVTQGIKKNKETVLLAVFDLIRNIKIENAPKDTSII